MDSRTDIKLDLDCYAVSHNRQEGWREVGLRITVDCQPEHICFQKIEAEKSLICNTNGECILFINLDCFTDFFRFADVQSGLVLCLAQDTLLHYPRAFYQTCICNFENVNTLESLDNMYSAASKIISMP